MTLPPLLQTLLKSPSGRGEQIIGHCSEGSYHHCWKFPSYDPASPFDFQLMQNILIDPNSHEMALSVTRVPNAAGQLILLTSKYEYQKIKSFCSVREEKYKSFNFKAVNYTKASVKEFYEINCRMLYRSAHEKYVYDPVREEVIAMELRQPSAGDLNQSGYFPALPAGPAGTLGAAYEWLRSGQRRGQGAAHLLAMFRPPAEQFGALIRLSEVEPRRDGAGKIIELEAQVAAFNTAPTPTESVYSGLLGQPPGIYVEMYADDNSPCFKFLHAYQLKSTANGEKRYIPMLSQFCTGTAKEQYREWIYQKKSGWLKKKYKRIHVIQYFSAASQHCYDV